MIEFQQVSKHFGTQDVLEKVSFQLNRGERVGIVGPNGAGKSTLFELITGQLDCDKGQINTLKGARIGYLRQQLNAHLSNDSILSHTMRSIPELEEIHDEIESLEASIKSLDKADQERALKRLGNLQDDYEHMGGYEMGPKAEAALSGLGFKVADFAKPFREFSGGWQMRAELARMLIGHPDILLLDEPSNYLDLPAVEWLQRFLRDFDGMMLLISHDRFLLESLTDLTLEVQGGNATRYPGGFSYYTKVRRERQAQLTSARANQDRKKAEVERFIERFRSKNTKATQVQSRIKQLEKMDVIEVPDNIRLVSPIRIPDAPHSGHEMIRLEKAGLTYDGSEWILKDIDLQLHRGDRTALVGFNGMGKTTLLRMLAGVKEISGGRRVLGHKVITGYQSQEFADTMSPGLTVYDIVRKAAPGTSDEKQVRNLLGSFGFSGDAIEKTCNILSGGEKIRLAFARIFANPPNLLLLDEPTTHLDLQGCETLEEALKKYTGTVCIVSHDVTFVKNVATNIIAMVPPGITSYCGDYQYYQEKTKGLDQAAASPQTSPQKKSGQVKKMAKEERKKALLRLRKETRATEKNIEKLEAEQAALLEQLAQDAGHADYEKMNRRLSGLQQTINKNMTRWESALAELEKVENMKSR